MLIQSLSSCLAASSLFLVFKRALRVSIPEEGLAVVFMSFNGSFVRISVVLLARVAMALLRTKSCASGVDDNSFIVALSSAKALACAGRSRRPSMLSDPDDLFEARLTTSSETVVLSGVGE